MPKTYSKQGTVQNFTTPFDVQTTRPLDIRLVVDSVNDLINGSIEAPYKGMVVNIAGTSELYILISEPQYADNPNNWKLVTGSGGDGLSKYSLPVMSKEMVSAATLDPDIDFNGSEDPYILIEDDMHPTEVEEDVYLSMIRDMAQSIRILKAEIARLKNSFYYGIDSYNDTRYAKGTALYDLGDVDEVEPLWAIDPGYLSMVPDSEYFNTLLDVNHKFKKEGGDIGSIIDVSVDGQLTFVDCTGVFYDGNEDNAPDDNLTLYKLDDSKLLTYLVTDKPSITLNLVSIDNKLIKRSINLEPILGGNGVRKYGFCIIISRKDGKTGTGFNYIYVSIINYETSAKLCEGYLKNDDTLDNRRVDIPERFSIESIAFNKLTLYRMKFYTKYEDFKDGVITSAPSEQDYKYEAAHIAIRSVQNETMLDAVAPHLRENELIWNKEDRTLHIKSDDKIYLIGSNEDDKQKDNNMTDKQIVDALKKMGIIVNAQYDAAGNLVDDSLSDISLAPISDVTFINEDTDKKFTFSVDAVGNLICKDKSGMTISEYLDSIKSNNYDVTDYNAVRGFSSDYLFKSSNPHVTDLADGVNRQKDAGKNADRLRISSFYAPITTDERHGCTHSYVELENTSDKDIPLTGVYIHFYNPTENNYQGGVHHLELDGVIKAGGTYLIRGAKHAEFDDESAFIKVKTFDKEWYENRELLSFEQIPASEMPGATADDKRAYRFCLTYGLATLGANDRLVKPNPGTDKDDKGNVGYIFNGNFYDFTTYPNIIVNPRFIDSCSFSTNGDVSKQNDTKNPWYANGNGGLGITIKANTLYRNMFALDPAKQAFNGFNGKDSSRIRYHKKTDYQVLDLNKEYIGFPFSDEIININRYTPKASFENKNVMTDKSQLNREKPNMVTCSFGVDVYNTRCFNWISCGTFDEYVWLRKKGETIWTKFESYKKMSEGSDPTNDTFVTTTVSEPTKKLYSPLVNNTVYARMVNRFPGNDVLFTSHKCVVILPDAQEPTVYEYVVGRSNKDGQPDSEHSNSVYTFKVYPREYEGRLYQITDQQGFHWIEYQVWAAAAKMINEKIDQECDAINAVDSNRKVFPILLNTGDMTQSGARINEWLDYYKGGQCLFNHLEQMNCVGNNDLCPINPSELGTGNDDDKSSSHFFHYFYCFDVKDTEKFMSADAEHKKFFSGESLIVKKHSGVYGSGDNAVNVNVTENKYIPSQYYFKTRNVLYIIVNSEIPYSNVKNWFGLCSNNHQYVNVYTGIEVKTEGSYAGGQLTNGTDVYDGYFTPIYETMYAWLKYNQDAGDSSKRVIVAMHEMPFTVITRASLAWGNSDQIKCTRNYPTNASRLGSNVNQLDKTEDRGIYWCSRLLEWFNCKLVIGGHKHTYALSYPIKEKYSWTYNGVTKDSIEEKKPMFSTLFDEAGSEPTYSVSWNVDISTDEVRNEYHITTDRTGNSSIPDSVPFNSTKIPYVPNEQYQKYGLAAFNGGNGQDGGLFRCCTPINVHLTKNDCNYTVATEADKADITNPVVGKTTCYVTATSKIYIYNGDNQWEEFVNSNPNYDGFVNYSMCQATGYKLKSNKELPWLTQVFSKIIPKTSIKKGADSPHNDQLYPMYSVLAFNNDCSELDVTMNRVHGIFLNDKGDTFTQLEFNTDPLYKKVKTLCTYEKEDSGYDDNPKERMYGQWLDEQTAKNRLAAYLEDQAKPVAERTGVSDNRYLHIKF